MDPEKIEQKLDRAAAGAVVVSQSIGGVSFTSMMEVMEFAKLMSLAKNAVPKHLQNEPGTCLAVCIQSLEWRMSPFAVANKSYEVNGRVAYESQLIHAVVEARAPITKRLRKVYSGEGPKRQCKVIGHFKGEVDPVEYDSPEIGTIKPKNSPLWTSDPDQQLWYYSVRAWARANCPDVLLGIYSEDELRDSEIGADNARDITPASGLKDRLKGQKGRGGFSPDNTAQLPAPTETPLPTAVEPVKTADPVTVDAKATPAEAQMTLSAGDVETEIEAKKRAIDNADDEADIRALVTGGTDFLKEHKRPDLIADLMGHAEKRGKKIGGKKVKAEAAA